MSDATGYQVLVVEMPAGGELAAAESVPAISDPGRACNVGCWVATTATNIYIYTCMIDK